MEPPLESQTLVTTSTWQEERRACFHYFQWIFGSTETGLDRGNETQDASIPKRVAWLIKKHRWQQPFIPPSDSNPLPASVLQPDPGLTMAARQPSSCRPLQCQFPALRIHAPPRPLPQSPCAYWLEGRGHMVGVWVQLEVGWSFLKVMWRMKCWAWLKMNGSLKVKVCLAEAKLSKLLKEFLLWSKILNYRK